MNAGGHPRSRWAAACAAFLIAGCGGGGGDGGGSNDPDPLNIANTALDDGVVGVDYSGQVVATGGSGSRTFALSGTLPAGLSLNATAGTITGTPTGPAGEADLSVTVTDSSSPPQTDTQAFTLRIAEPLVADVGTPPMASIGTPYSHAFTVSGGTPPYSFSVDLPSGLSIDADGVIGGAPAADARTTVGVATITDSASPTQVASFDLRVPVELTVSTTALPDAGGGEPYEAQLQAQGGLPDFSWDKTGGTAPANVSSGGLVSGPFIATCAVSDYTLDVAVTDDDFPAQTASRVGITLSVVPQAVSLQESSAPPVATIGEGYSFTVGFSPGVSPYTFAIIAGALPPGISLNAGSGTLSGTSNTSGTFGFTVQVTDGCGETDTRAFSLIVRSAPTGRNDSIGTATPAGNGTLVATISPSGHPNSVFDADEDYYVVQTTATSTITVDLIADFGSSIDTVVELVDAGGNRLQTCGSPQFNQECMNDDREPGNLDSLLVVRVTGATTFYIHVVEWRGDGRPDLQYSLELSGIN